MIRIESIELHEISMPLIAPFQTSFGITQQRRILLVEVGAEGLTGWGEVTAGEAPFYNPEWVDQAWLVLRNFLVPMLLGQSVERATDIPQLLARVRGSEMSKAALENAVWDIEAQQKQLPLSRLLGGTRHEIACGVSLGLRESIAELIDVVERELACGYQRIKLKIQPGQDLALVEAVRSRFPEILLSVDANSAYEIGDTAILQALDDFNLLMIEQPLAWDEIYEHAALQAMLKTAICLDECIRNLRHAQAAAALKACRVLNIKLGRVAGHSEARRIQGFAQLQGLPVWCGGMLESGVGRAHNVAMSTLPGFTLPGDVSASARYWQQDIIEPAVEVTPQGVIEVPAAPGLGYAVNRRRVQAITTARERFSETTMVTI
jgi:o-succinylbenzoate synthase